MINRYRVGMIFLFTLLISTSVFSQAPYIVTTEGAGQYGYFEKDAQTYYRLNSNTHGNIYQLFVREWVGYNHLVYGIGAPFSHEGGPSGILLNTLDFDNSISGWDAGLTVYSSVHADYWGGGNSYGGNPNQTGFNERSFFVIDVASVNNTSISSAVYPSQSNVVMTFTIQAGGASGLGLRRFWMINEGSAQETDDISNDGFQLFWEAVTGTESFDGTEDFETIYGDYNSNPTNNNVYGHDNLNSGDGISIPTDGLRVYVVLNNLSSNYTAGRTIQVSMTNDGMSLTPSRDGSFQLVRVNQTPSTGNGAQVVLVPQAPIIKFATQILNDGFTANWSPSAGATEYRLDVSTSNSFDSFIDGYEDFNTGEDTSVVITGLTGGTEYFYRVRAVGAGETSTNSGIQSLITAYATANSGLWSETNTWSGGNIPPSGANVTIKTGHHITLNQHAMVGYLFVQSGASFNGGSGNFHLEFTSSGILEVEGTFTTNTEIINFQSNGSILGTFSLKRMRINGTVHPGNITITDSVTIRSNGSFSASPLYGSNSTLIFSHSLTIGIDNTFYGWLSGSTPGLGVPKHVRIHHGSISLYSHREISGNLIIQEDTLRLHGPYSLRVFGDVEIANTGVLYLSASPGGDLYVHGNFENAGVLASKNRQVTFYGTTSQTISGMGTYHADSIGNDGFAFLEIAKSAQTLNLARDIQVKTRLMFTQGVLNMNSYVLEMLNPLPDGGIDGVFRHSGHIVGELKREVGTTQGSRLFPIGTSDRYRGLTVNLNSTITQSGSLTATFISSTPGDSGLPVSESGYDIDATKTSGYWQLINTDITLSGTFDMSLNAYGMSTINFQRSYILTRTATDWTLNGTHVNGTVSKENPILHRTGMTLSSEMDFAFGYNSTETVEVIVDDGNPWNGKVLLQGFWWDYWNNNYPNSWATYLTKLTPRLKSMGIDKVWIPPTVKNGGTNSVGYSPFDHYDLGDKFQKGSATTRFGSKDEFLRMVAVMHANGIEVIQDIVFNHMDNAGSQHGNGGEDPDGYSNKYKNFRYTSYENPAGDESESDYLQRSGRFPKNWQNFHPNPAHNTEYDEWTAGHFGPDICFYGGAYGQSSNATYNPTQSSDYMRNGMRDWMIWNKKQTGIDGYRFDAVKHFPHWAIQDFIYNVKYNAGWANGGSNMFAVGEWVGGASELDGWINDVRYSNSGSEDLVGTFDFGLRGAIYGMISGSGFYNMADIPGSQQSNRYRTVPFVNNHDTFRPQLDGSGYYIGWNEGQELAAHIEPTDPRIQAAYAIMMAVDGTPQIFFEDLFDVGTSGKRWSHEPEDEIDLVARDWMVNLIWAYQKLSFKAGAYLVRSSGADHLIIEREGRAIIAATDHWNSWQEVYNVQTSWAPGTQLRDYSGANGDAIRTVDGTGKVQISIPPCDGTAPRRGYSIWAPIGANEDEFAPAPIPTTQEWEMANDLGDSHPNSLQQGGALPANSTAIRTVGYTWSEAGTTVEINVFPVDTDEPYVVELYNHLGTKLFESSSTTGNGTYYYTPNHQNWLVTRVRNANTETNGQNLFVKLTYMGPQNLNLYDSALPVTLGQTRIVVENGIPTLEWVVESELNNSEWRIERKKADEQSPVQIAVIAGRGTSPDRKVYRYADTQAEYGISYHYRIADVAYDGTVTYHGWLQFIPDIAQEFTLVGNYPNPFNPTTTILVNFYATQRITLTVYNMLGQEIMVPFKDFEVESGSRHLQIHMNTLPSGIYFYTIQNNFGVSKSGRMTFIK